MDFAFSSVLCVCKAIETVRNTLMGKDQAAEEMRQVMSECSGRTTGSEV